MSRVVILNSLVGDKEKSKIESILKDNLDIIDINSLIVVNERCRDILIIKDRDRSKSIEKLMRRVDVLIGCGDIDMNSILDKILDHGIGSLESYEIKYLDRS